MMTSPLPLMSVSADPELLVLRLDPSSTADVTSGWSDAGLAVRTVRGTKMQTVAQLFDEVSAAMQFPYYFGENWNALNECLSEIDWIPFGNGLVVVIRDAALVLADDTAEQLQTFVKILTRAHTTYATPVEDGEWWDRPAVPFHVILHGADEKQQDEIETRWQAAGAVLAVFPG